MNSKPLLTLGIPTFNRAEIVSANLRDIIENKLDEVARVLVIDNASLDGTFEKLKELSRGRENIRIIRQDYNVQLFGNVLDLHRYCDTEYLWINSDEDFFCPRGFKWANDFLLNSNVNFLSGAVSFYSKNLYRNRKAVINEKTIRAASNYGSGLIYRNSMVVDYLDFLEVNKGIELMWLYPMFATALLVFLNSPNFCYEESVILSNKQHQVETLIEDGVGGKYYHLESRIRQIRSLPHLASELRRLFGTDKSGLIDGWLEGELQEIFPTIRNSLLHEGDQRFLQYFDDGASKFCKRIPLLRVKMILNGFLHRI